MTSDDQSRPDGAMPCGRCGYDLRGTPAGGVCGECGLPVIASATGPTPGWLRRVKAGGWVLAAFLFGFFPVAVFCSAAMSDGGHARAVAALLVAFGLLGATGVWLLTTPGSWATGAARTVVRGWGVSNLLVVAGGAARAVAVPTAPASILNPGTAAAVAALGPCAAITIGYVRSIAVLVGRRRLLWQCTVTAVGLGVAIPGSVLGLLTQPDRVTTAWVAGWMLLVTDVFGFGVWAIAVMCQFAFALLRVRLAVRAVLTRAAAGLNDPPGRLYNPAEPRGRSGEQKANP